MQALMNAVAQQALQFVANMSFFSKELDADFILDDDQL